MSKTALSRRPIDESGLINLGGSQKPKVKHRKNCESCPTQTTWKVEFKGQICLTCLSSLTCLSCLSHVCCLFLLSVLSVVSVVSVLPLIPTLEHEFSVGWFLTETQFSSKPQRESRDFHVTKCSENYHFIVSQEIRITSMRVERVISFKLPKSVMC